MAEETLNESCSFKTFNVEGSEIIFVQSGVLKEVSNTYIYINNSFVIYYEQ